MAKILAGSPLGTALRNHRKERGLTQGELALRAGLAERTIRLLEQGGGGLDSFVRATDALGVALSCRNASAETIGGLVATLRARRGLSKRELASVSGLSQPTIKVLEREGGGRLSTLERVLTVLGAGAYLVPQGSRRAFYTHSGNASVGQTWETPQGLLLALYAVFGRFDLDPCSPRKTTPPVRARMHFTAEDDGLGLSWYGRVFVNPPYGRFLASWVAKSRHEFEAGHAGTVVALIPARTDTGYWHEHIAGRASVWFLRGRLRFSDGEQSAPFPSALVVYGASPEELENLGSALNAWRAS